MKDPQDVLKERPDDFVKPPMRWNTGLLQYEVDLDHEKPINAPERPRSWLAFWSVFPFAIDTVAILLALVFVVLLTLYLLLGF